jgi:hypothetical protein
LSRPLAKILEPVVERDFFFEQSGDHFSYWPHRDRINNKESSDFRFRGGFLDYLAYMEKLGPEMLTLLPKYFMLFYFEVCFKRCVFLRHFEFLNKSISSRLSQNLRETVKMPSPFSSPYKMAYSLRK